MSVMFKEALKREQKAGSDRKEIESHQQKFFVAHVWGRAKLFLNFLTISKKIPAVSQFPPHSKSSSFCELKPHTKLLAQAERKRENKNAINSEHLVPCSARKQLGPILSHKSKRIQSINPNQLAVTLL